MDLAFLNNRACWREKAACLKPALVRWEVSPASLVAIQEDSNAWQGVSVSPIGPSVSCLELAAGESAILDFGEHLVGRVSFSLSNRGQDFDSPVMIRFLAAETPYELTYSHCEYHGILGIGWMQEETMRLSQSGDVTLPNRLAMRYLRVEVLSAPAHAVLSCIRMVAESAVGKDLPAAPAGLDELGRKIYQISCRTLRDCMQGVFEDGPKRDRRLWTGDLRLQALVNASTYRNVELVERSLYLLAANTSSEGLFPSCVYEQEKNSMSCKVLEYPLLLAPILLEHVRAYGRKEIADELFDLAAWQFKLVECLEDSQSLMHDDHRAWLFIDHAMGLEKDTALQAACIWGLSALDALAKFLGRDSGNAIERADKLRNALRRYRYDEKRGLFFSGDNHQFSIASQAWAVLAGVVHGEEARELLARAVQQTDVFRPCTPYMQHYFLEACQCCGATQLQQAVIRDYWGGMVETGANTFYEIYSPDDPFYSTYNDAWVNSACHAWSCTPALFLGK